MNSKLLQGLFLFIAAAALVNCSNPSTIIESNPAVTLKDVPGGFRYGQTYSSDPVIYQAPPTEAVYTFNSCDSAIGTDAYNALKLYMHDYGIESVIISEDKTIYLLEMPLVQDPYSYEYYVFYPGQYSDSKTVIGQANQLLYATMPVTQYQELGNSWFRVTTFPGRNADYMGLFDF